MATLTDKELQEIYELQRKLFTTSTENNPYLKNNTINPDLNKGLNTDSKTIIGAINDIFAITTATRDTNAEFIDRFNRIIGNEQLNPTLVKKLSQIGNNFYDALFKSWEVASTGLEKVEILDRQIDEVKESIENIVINGVTNGTSIAYEDKRFTGKVFNIACTPISEQSPAIYINGVHYDRDCFEATNNNKTFTWIATDFDIVCNYKKATEYDCLKTYYTKSGTDYIECDNLDRETFNDGTFYEVNEDLSDKVIIRYNSFSTNNRSYYRSLYDISLLNNIFDGIGRDPYNNNELIKDYNWNRIAPILNKNLVGKFNYTDDGKVRIILDNRESSNFITVSEKNWDLYDEAAKVFIGDDITVTTFDDFCNAVTGETENDIKWVSFFAFEIGDNANIFMITDKTDPIELADKPCPGDFYYDWDSSKTGDDRALKMADLSYNPYIDLTRIFPRLQENYNND